MMLLGAPQRMYWRIRRECKEFNIELVNAHRHPAGVDQLRYAWRVICRDMILGITLEDCMLWERMLDVASFKLHIIVYVPW